MAARMWIVTAISVGVLLGSVALAANPTPLADATSSVSSSAAGVTTSAPVLAVETVRLTNGPPTTLSIARAGDGHGPGRPVILTLGSFREDALPDWSTNLLQEGFMIVAFTAEYAPDPDPSRRPVWLHFDARFAHSYVLGGLRTPKDTSRVIDYLTSRPDVDPRRIGWLGSSTTGIFGLAAATREPRLRAIVAFVSTGAYEKWFATWKPNGLWQATDTNLWPETVDLFPEADPIRRATNLFPCATLIVNGGADKVVDLSSARAFVEAARPAYKTDPDRLRLVVYDGLGHNLPYDIVARYAEHWFRRYLAPAPDATEGKAAAAPITLPESTRQTALTPTPHETLIGAASAGSSAAEPLQAFMPRPEDYTLVWWADGPPSYLGSTQPAASGVLCFQAGTWGMAFDTRQMRLLRFGAFPQPMTASQAMQPGRHALEGLPSARWDCALIVGDRRFTCTGHRTPKDEFFQPVQVVESGHFFQRVVINDLEFVDDTGQRFAGTGQLEISAWPDRLAFHLIVHADEVPFTGNIELRLGTDQLTAKQLSRSEALLVTASPPANGSVRVEGESALKTGNDEVLGCLTVALPEQAWNNAKGTYYPEEHLDRMDRWRLTLHNDSDQDQVLRLMLTQERHLPITGFTPLLCDQNGAPTGIPIQISKNWHQRPEKGSLPHQGPWFHGCTFVRLPPRSHREFTLEMVYARYGGVFAASHAQLSLIGWGHNQFWDEAAIGSFGESICFEPGRVQRRCFIDDLRPLLTLPESADAKPYGWADNCGGGDFLMWQDVDAHYQPFRATRTDYRAYGPCLTEVVYSEETCGGELGAQVTVSLPRSQDYLRTFIRLRYDVRQPMRWRRLAFFQLGADFYNETPSRRVAFGDIDGVREEWEPKLGKDEADRPAQPLSGREPWVSIHGLDRGALRAGTAAASRGLVVRHWNATLAGKPCPLPCLSSWCTEWGKDNHRTVLELSPPPDITELERGDFVEAELELVVFPARAPAYYGPDREFRSALTKNADSSRLVQAEAAGNALQIDVRHGRLLRPYPIEVVVDSDQTAELSVGGGLGYVPLTFEGLTHLQGYSVWLDDRRVDQSIHGRDFWQTDYDPVSRKWRITYNLRLASPGKTQRNVKFAPDPAQ